MKPLPEIISHATQRLQSSAKFFKLLLDETAIGIAEVLRQKRNPRRGTRHFCLVVSGN